LERVAIWLRGGTAVYAGEVASLRYFPDGNEWALIKISRVDLRVHESMEPHNRQSMQ
jgi:hypothetical protein